MNYDLNSLGWKAFQDLCIALAEECLKRPVQKFLEVNDAGRDGAFRGRWKGRGENAGASTIQCKFTSVANKKLTLSALADELGKVTLLAKKRLADDYIIITNYDITGRSELGIKKAFENAGAGTCRVFGSTWIVDQIQKSARLRMMVPRLYGLGDLSNILDERAYAQAKMILSSLGDDLRRLVVTDAHRKSVRAITSHNFALLLGAPAAGKSTIGASLAVGAADMWGSSTIRATSPEEIKDHLNPNERQFFWVDDAWGSTQYQGNTIEGWNKILPFIQAATQRGTQFLLTSRDYIWKAAYNDLKTQALPLLDRSRVIINVHELTTREKSQILYNHIKLGDQPQEVRRDLKPMLPKIVESENFLPESARRLGTMLFTTSLSLAEGPVLDFIEHPAKFLLDTIKNLAADCRAAIALIFISGGRVGSPIGPNEELGLSISAFGVTAAAIRDALNALNGSLLLLAHDAKGPYWTYKHPTIADAFAQLVAGNPELTEIYLRGAKPEVLLREVVCPGVSLKGASVIVPESLYALLISRIASVDAYKLGDFIAHRSNKIFTQLALDARPDLFSRLVSFYAPIANDMDAPLLARLHNFGLLPEELRAGFVNAVRKAAVDDADASFLNDKALRAVLTEDELDSIFEEVEREVFPRIDEHVDRLREEWNENYDPSNHFDNLQDSIKVFVREIGWRANYTGTIRSLDVAVDDAIEDMRSRYRPPSRSSAPAASTPSPAGPIGEIFRDIDD